MLNPFNWDERIVTGEKKPKRSRYDPPAFGGPHEPEDEPTFRSDLARIRAFFLSHPNQWYSKEELRVAVDLPVGKDVTPRIRDLRKQRFGAMRIVMKKIKGQYRYILPIVVVTL